MLLRAENVCDTTISNYIVVVKLFLKFLETRKQKITVDNAYLFLSKYENSRTRNRYGATLKKYFVLTEHLEADRFKVPRNKPAKLPDILSEAEVMRLAKACDNIRDRALILVAYESSRRNSEIRNLRIRDVKVDQYGAEVLFRSTKTVDANIRLMMSAPSLQTWIEHHRDRDNPDAYVFYGYNDQMTAERFRQIVREATSKAGLKRRVWPHLLRHSRIAALKQQKDQKKKLSDDDIMNISGHRDRHMLDRYGKITMAMTNQRLLEAAGLVEEEGEVKTSVNPQACPRCKFLNSPLSEYCGRCGMVLDEKTAQLLMEKERKREELMELLRDPAVLAKLKGE